LFCRTLPRSHRPAGLLRPRTARADFVAFLAVGESQSDPHMYMQNNVVNFVNLLDAMVSCGCKYVIKSSTSSSYGEPDESEIPLKEDYQTRYRPTESALGLGTANFPGGDGAELAGESLFLKFIAYYHSLYADRPELSLDEVRTGPHGPPHSRAVQLRLSFYFLYCLSHRHAGLWRCGAVCV
jgi:hypothetical protein